MTAQVISDDSNIELSLTLVKTALGLAVSWAALSLALGAPHLFSAAIAAVVGFSAAIYLHSAGRHMAARTLWIVTANLAIFFGSLVVHEDGHVAFMLVATAGLPFPLYHWERRRKLIIFLSALSFTLWGVALYLHVAVLTDYEVANATATLASTILVGVTVFLMVVSELGYFSYFQARYRARLQSEFQLSQLLGESRLKFLESINHEIRTPLNAIVGLSSLLKDTAVLDEGRKEHVTLIHDAGLKIAEMMEKSERLVSLRSDDRLEALTTENIPELVADVAWQFFRNDPDRHVRVQSEKEINARVSKDLLRTALAELLDNVQKYTPKGSSVDVSVQEVGEQIVISMEDNGPGFDPERLGEMGNDFLRLNHGHGTIRGLGIGLTIAMETMLRVGGRLEIRNREQGGAVQALLIPKS